MATGGDSWGGTHRRAPFSLPPKPVMKTRVDTVMFPCRGSLIGTKANPQKLPESREGRLGKGAVEVEHPKPLHKTTHDCLCGRTVTPIATQPVVVKGTA